MARASAAAVLFALVGCGPTVTTAGDGTGDTGFTDAAAEDDSSGAAVEGCDPLATPCVVTLRPSWETHVYVELSNAHTREHRASETPPPPGEVHGRVGRFLNLFSALDDAVCLLGETYGSLDEVPTDPGLCDCDVWQGCWGINLEFGLLGGEPNTYEGRGFLMRAAGGALYRGRVLRENADVENSVLTFEYEGIL